MYEIHRFVILCIVIYIHLCIIPKWPLGETYVNTCPVNQVNQKATDFQDCLSATKINWLHVNKLVLSGIKLVQLPWSSQANLGVTQMASSKHRDHPEDIVVTKILQGELDKQWQDDFYLDKITYIKIKIHLTKIKIVKFQKIMTKIQTKIIISKKKKDRICDLFQRMQFIIQTAENQNNNTLQVSSFSQI